MKRDARTCLSMGGRRTAFSLVELLVVVAIIAALLAVLLPGLRMAREQAVRVTCMSHLRALAQAWQYYLDEHEGRFPVRKANDDINYGGRQGTGSRAFGANARRPVTKYLNTFLKLPAVTTEPLMMYRCPRDKGSDSVSPSYYVSRGTSYRANHFLIGRNPNCRNWDANDGVGCEAVCENLRDRVRDLSRGVILAPATVLLVGDFPWRNAWEWKVGRLPIQNWHARQGYFNMAFLDTHTEFIRIQPRVWTTATYTVAPLMDLATAAAESCGANSP